jgi:hypothetical protein
MWRRYKKQHWYYRGATPASKRRKRRWSLRDSVGQTRTTLVAHWRWTVVALALVIAGVTLSYMGSPSPDWTPSQLAVGTNPASSSARPADPTTTTQPLSPGVVPPAPAAPPPGTVTHLSALPRVAGLPFTGVAPSKAPVVAAATKAPASAPTATAAKPPATTAATNPHPTTTTSKPPPTTTQATTPVTDPPTTTTQDTAPPTTTTQDTAPPTTTTTDTAPPTTTTNPLAIDLPPLPLS